MLKRREDANEFSPCRPLGYILGAYQIESVISPAGSDATQGSVYKAKVLEACNGLQKGDFVAIKEFLLKSDLSEQEQTARIRAVYDRVSSLNHPHIIRYLDFFIHKDADRMSSPCIVTELLQGNTLADEIRRSRKGLAWTDVRKIFLQILDGLQAAADEGIIHRDIKPSNVFILPGLQVKLIDFDIALVEGVQVAERSDRMYGAYDYMAPEFALFKEADFRGDHISDIFSLTTVFYECLTGSLPFGKLEGDAQANYLTRWTTQAGKPSQFAEGGPFWLLDGLSELVCKGLHGNPKQRFKSFKEIQSAVEALVPRTLTSSRTGTKYKLLEYIGRGGFGEVFKASISGSDTDRYVAIKKLNCDVKPDRFEREARILEKLSQNPHPNCIAYHEFVQNAHGRFIVMDYLEGMPGLSLQYQLLDQYPNGLPLQTAVILFIAYAEAAAFFHNNGICHRDLTPANLYAPVKFPEKAKIFDFGIARDARGSKTSGMLPGNLNYMAPDFSKTEGFRGDSLSDIYTLGLSFYEAVTGRPALESIRYADKRDGWAAYVERASKGLMLDYTSREVRAFFEHNGPLKDLLVQATAPNRKYRYESMDQMVNDLHRLFARISEPVLKERQVDYEKEKDYMEHEVPVPPTGPPWVKLTGILLLTAVLLVGGVVFWHAFNPEKKSSREIDDFARGFSITTNCISRLEEHYHKANQARNDLVVSRIGELINIQVGQFDAAAIGCRSYEEIQDLLKELNLFYSSLVVQDVFKEYDQRRIKAMQSAYSAVAQHLVSQIQKASGSTELLNHYREKNKYSDCPAVYQPQNWKELQKSLDDAFNKAVKDYSNRTVKSIEAEDSIKALMELLDDAKKLKEVSNRDYQAIETEFRTRVVQRIGDMIRQHDNAAPDRRSLEQISANIRTLQEQYQISMPRHYSREIDSLLQRSSRGQGVSPAIESLTIETRTLLETPVRPVDSGADLKKRVEAAVKLHAFSAENEPDSKALIEAREHASTRLRELLTSYIDLEKRDGNRQRLGDVKGMDLSQALSESDRKSVLSALQQALESCLLEIRNRGDQPVVLSGIKPERSISRGEIGYLVLTREEWDALVFQTTGGSPVEVELPRFDRGGRGVAEVSQKDIIYQLKYVGTLDAGEGHQIEVLQDERWIPLGSEISLARGEYQIRFSRYDHKSIVRKQMLSRDDYLTWPTDDEWFKKHHSVLADLQTFINHVDGIETVENVDRLIEKVKEVRGSAAKEIFKTYLEKYNRSKRATSTYPERFTPKDMTDARFVWNDLKKKTGLHINDTRAGAQCVETILERLEPWVQGGKQQDMKEVEKQRDNLQSEFKSFYNNNRPKDSEQEAFVLGGRGSRLRKVVGE